MLLVLAGLVVDSGRGSTPVTIADYTDRDEALLWGQRSHWKQPWRSYIDTVPAGRFRDAIGVNFNVSPKWATKTARLLGESGFRHARIEVGWNNIDYEDPSGFKDGALENLRTTVGALRDNGIRPLILLNANHGEPCPVRRDAIRLTSPAGEGDTEIHIDPADTAKIEPGRTGISQGGVAARQLITAVGPDGTATMSQPLRESYPADELTAVTLLYEPFRPPELEDGNPNPSFEPTMRGWLDYVGVVTSAVESILGSEEFDVEVWNELSFGSNFLSINRYHEPNIEWSSSLPTDAVRDRTVAYVRNPSNGVPNIGVSNGFASQRPWGSGAISPVGLTALSKHPYAGWEEFPEDAQVNGNRPLNGLGEPDGWRDDDHQWHESFTPDYDIFLPERFLTALHTETMVYDLAPFETPIFGTPHGRHTHPEGGDPPTMWVTEVNMNPAAGPTPRSEMSDADMSHVRAKVILRYLTAFINKGVTAVDIWAARGGALGIIDDEFFAAGSSAPYPGTALGGETMDAVRRLAEAVPDDAPITVSRSLELRALTDYEGNVQFEGNPDDPTHFPPLYNRDVLAFLPFQTSDTGFAIPVYVMTRNVAEVHAPGSAGPSRFDLPPERYRMAIGGVRGDVAEVSALDPLDGRALPVDVIEGNGDELVVEMGVTDSPRLLMIQERVDPLPAPVQNGSRPALVQNGSPTGPSLAVQRARRKDRAAVSARVSVRGARSLLRRRRLRVAARCATPCRLRAAGWIATGTGQRFRMRALSRGPRHRALRRAPTFTLALNRRVAKTGGRLRRRGRPLRVGVSVRVLTASGRAKRVRRVFVLPGRRGKTAGKTGR